jgi:hypothetical protein
MVGSGRQRETVRAACVGAAGSVVLVVDISGAEMAEMARYPVPGTRYLFEGPDTRYNDQAEV